ncbi:hypothetical protein C6499_14450 [Candidatus Poribacteria bacterium]|nr:MAG: hypothetical protein C6499_14450 [Candidatus Poribacteria bacterium]
MSETQQTLFNKRVSRLLIAGAFVLLAIYLARSTPDPEAVEITPSPPDRVRQTTSEGFEVSDAFYRTIIDNNLFRPLGWTPPRPIEPYRLLGTRLLTDKNTSPQAILQSTATNKTHIVTIGDKLDADTQAIDIQSKQIRLETAGQ